MKNKILIFSATYNEAKNIKFLLDSLLKLKLSLDILIIDDNSPDKTWEVVKNYKKRRKNIHLILRKKKLGLDTAHKLAFNYSIKKKYDYFISLDADLSHDPKKIPLFIKELKRNPFVIGSRYIKGGKCGMKGFRLFLSYFGNQFMQFIFNIKSTEFTSAYRGFNIKKLKGFNLKSVSSEGYSFFMETVFLIHKNGLFVKEVPIYFRDRKKGKSKIPKLEILRTLFNIFKLKLIK
jgi:dolichol-phosphate mannosyltransferase